MSFWLEEDGCGVLFSRSEDSDDEYFLIQRHFEEPDDGRPYIETDDEKLCGHFRRVVATLERDRLDIGYGSNDVAVSFALSDEAFQGVTKVLRVLVPSIQLVGRDPAVPHNGG